ncbi:hypothetical protein [Novipirellula artificiosorum]|uniref:PKMT C-terminal winged helix domain-containing protein n=1 Tax=Novipirellula artificiosorum TaxID=2528016 RepID=A0A5C6DEM6_9BACT|nr:hypothetical protein [Novipirellula artificiosorum]TWU34191.1 hypothetical protein Poly41_43370 [Novipirellula artificiosorum]
MFNPDPMIRSIVPLIDGTKTKQELVACVFELAKEGKLAPNVEGNSSVEVNAACKAILDQVLDQLHQSALLV